MSQHPSLRSSDKDKAQRSVLKRHEKIKILKDKELWDEKKDSAFGLPKVKVVRFKIKKEKAAAATAEGAATEGAAAAPATGAPAATPGAKGTAAPAAKAAPTAKGGDEKKEAKK